MKHTGVRVRRQELFERMLEGDSPTSLKQQWLLRNDELTIHSYDKDITWCYNQLSKFKIANADEIIQHHIIMYDENIKQARELGAIGAANQAMQYKEKLLGLHKQDVAVQVNTQNNTLDFGNKSVEEILKILDAAK